MNLKQLETFVWVSTLGSFRKAAKKLNTSQPAISSRIVALEETLGVELFRRHAGSFELTAKGVELLPQAQKLILQAERFKEKACESNALSGILRLGASETIVHTWLSDFLNKAHKQFPNVNIEVSVDVTANMRNELVARSLDLAFLMGPISEYSIHNEELKSFELKWVCSSDFDISDIVSIEEMFAHPIMTYARNTRPFAEVQAFARGIDIENLRLFPSTSLAAIMRMTLDGLGIAMLPTTMVEEEIAKGRLKVIESNWQPSNLEFTASYSREPFNPIVEKMAELAITTAWEF
ncbi:LysR family transcriptional regulator [Sneathiella sp. P13V-1]|uniref:LysR family transcriptional regulator n=1 Tax=Sneathiella sp. P13V-1 TaxID=2697366 RepID=UPI00187B707B|nr:LysR family transcriptional regulator [Sneathiella sp. P13V-1]MBE7637205.1 LysR family transcriptional regulator [Sneathiella sp. P13V-1]